MCQRAGTLGTHRQIPESHWCTFVAAPFASACANEPIDGYIKYTFIKIAVFETAASRSRARCSNLSAELRNAPLCWTVAISTSIVQIIAVGIQGRCQYTLQYTKNQQYPIAKWVRHDCPPKHQRQSYRLKSPSLPHREGSVLRAGCKSPPAVSAMHRIAAARERPDGPFTMPAGGQQIWCDARADGHSPDERDRARYSCCMGFSAHGALRLRLP
jgi:hypothetical protein